MQFLRSRCLVPVAALTFFLSSVSFAADSVALSAGELASKLSAVQEDGSAYIRLKMEINGPKKETLQIQIKQRRTKGTAEVVYQILFPKERKGESVLLRRSGNRFTNGTLFLPPGTLRPITDVKDALLGSDLSYEDVIENFFAWEQQSIVGTETVQNVPCQILESKPGKGGNAIYGSVKSWIDPERLVPLRVEKYSSSGQLLRRIETTRVVSDGDHHIPADLVVRGAHGDSSTAVDGSRIKHDVKYNDNDFTPEGLKDLTVPRGSTE
jgi:hypothetical protein